METARLSSAWNLIKCLYMYMIIKKKKKHDLMLCVYNDPIVRYILHAYIFVYATVQFMIKLFVIDAELMSF